MALDNREAREAGSWRLRRTHMEENATRTLEVWFPSFVGSTLCQFRDQRSAHIGEMRRKYGALLDSLCWACSLEVLGAHMCDGLID